MSSSLSRRFLPLLAAVMCAAVALFALRGPDPRAGEPPYFAIKGARIVPVSGPVIENGTIVIANGLIKAVGANATIPSDAAVIDGAGLTVYPGLIDAMSEVGLPAAAPTGGGRGGGGGGIAALLAAQANVKQSWGPEDRPATTPWSAGADEFNASDARIVSWRDAGFTTTVSTPQGGIFPGQGSIMDLGGDRADEMSVKLHATLPIRLQPGGAYTGFPDSLMGVLAYVHQVFIDTQWAGAAEGQYSAHPSGIARPTTDRTERVVGAALAANEPVLFSATTPNQIRRVLWLAPQWISGKHIVLYDVQQGYETPGEIAASHFPAIVSLKFPELPRDADAENPPPLRELRVIDRAPSTPGALAKAGVKIAFYSDGLTNPKDMIANARKAIAAGLSSDAALRAFTLDAADILGVADRTGSIEAGKIANLTITDGDLFNEKTKVKIVFVDGKRYEIHEAPPGPPGGGRGGRGGRGPGEDASEGGVR